VRGIPRPGGRMQGAGRSLVRADQGAVRGAHSSVAVPGRARESTRGAVTVCGGVEEHRSPPVVLCLAAVHEDRALTREPDRRSAAPEPRSWHTAWNEDHVMDNAI